MLDIYVDADGCPVKEETYRVARRYGLKVFVVSNRPIRVPFETGIQAIVVGDAFDAADDWIATHAGEDDLVVTADILLADRCLQAGARVLGPKGREFDADNIGAAKAQRELADQLRQMGFDGGGPAPMGRADRSQFLGAMDAIVQRVKRSRAG